MKKKLVYILAAALPMALCLSVSTLDAQDYVSAPVTVSTEKVKLGGKLFYSHIVLEKQTIFSISKAYNTTVDEIYSANPGLKENGLKKNAIILIPIPGAEPAVKASAETKAPETEAERPERTVAVARVMETPAKVEEADEDEDSRAERKKKNKTDKDGYIIHIVRWFEDLDAISEKYGIPVDMIMEINDLSGRKLKNRQKLRIPADIDSFMKAAKDSNAEEKEDSKEVAKNDKAEKNH